MGQLFVCAKSPALVPPMEMELMVSAAVPVFVSVTPWGEPFVLTAWLPNESVLGTNTMAGPETLPYVAM
jgi:hypothetical protein